MHVKWPLNTRQRSTCCYMLVCTVRRVYWLQPRLSRVPINGYHCNGLLLGREVIQTNTFDVNNANIRANNKSNTITVRACSLTRRSGRAFFFCHVNMATRNACALGWRGTVLIGRPRPSVSNEVCSGCRGRNEPCCMLAGTPTRSDLFTNSNSATCARHSM